MNNKTYSYCIMNKLWVNKVNDHSDCVVPTLSLGIIFKSEPCFKNIVPAAYWGLIPTPVLVMIAVVAGFTLNCSATNLMHAVNGASSGTDMLYDFYDQ